LAAVRVDDFKYRFTDQPGGWLRRHREGRLADPGQFDRYGPDWPPSDRRARRWAFPTRRWRSRRFSRLRDTRPASSASTPILSNDDSPEIDVAVKPTSPTAGLGRRAGAWVLHEFREILPPMIFFLSASTWSCWRRNLILAGYLVAFGNFMLATAAALVVGKAVLVTNAMPFLRHYDRAPLIQPILFKTVVIGPWCSLHACSNISSGSGLSNTIRAQ
jgi:hypothetical protein